MHTMDNFIYVGTHPTNLGDVWRQMPDGRYRCGFKIMEAKDLARDIQDGFITVLRDNLMHFISSNACSFTYDGVEYRVERKTWTKAKLPNVWPAADCYLRILSYLATGLFDEYFKICK